MKIRWRKIMILTKSGGAILGPISRLLGALLSLIYDGLDAIGLKAGIIGVSIILFTIVIRMLMFPLTFKQNKSGKISNYIQPELNKINKKYKGKKDQQSMMAQQQEIRELQAKYGVNLTSGCLTSFLQLPIFFALYRVILNVPAYVSKVYDMYKPIADSIMNSDKTKALEEFTKTKSGLSFKADGCTTNTIIDTLAKFESKTWDEFAAFVQNNDVAQAIDNNKGSINDAYSFLFGINLTSVPGFALTAALLIPILSMVFQFLSIHATPQQPAQDPQQEQTMKTMKTFMNIMPIMSFIVCVNVPAGVGLYWAMGALVSCLTSLGVNFYFKHCDMDKVVAKSAEKAAKKAAERKAKGKKTFMERMQEAAYGQEASNSAGTSRNVANTSLKNYSSATSKNNNANTKYKAGSLASKANAMQRYNDNGGNK